MSTSSSKNQKSPRNPFDVPNPEKVWEQFLKDSKPVSKETIKQRVQESKQAYQKGSK